VEEALIRLLAVSKTTQTAEWFQSLAQHLNWNKRVRQGTRPIPVEEIDTVNNDQAESVGHNNDCWH
jgi:hypothetical protein